MCWKFLGSTAPKWHGLDIFDLFWWMSSQLGLPGSVAHVWVYLHSTSLRHLEAWREGHPQPSLLVFNCRKSFNFIYINLNSLISEQGEEDVWNATRATDATSKFLMSKTWSVGVESVDGCWCWPCWPNESEVRLRQVLLTRGMKFPFTLFRYNGEVLWSLQSSFRTQSSCYRFI